MPCLTLTPVGVQVRRHKGNGAIALGPVAVNWTTQVVRSALCELWSRSSVSRQSWFTANTVSTLLSEVVSELKICPDHQYSAGKMRGIGLTTGAAFTSGAPINIDRRQACSCKAKATHHLNSLCVNVARPDTGRSAETSQSSQTLTKPSRESKQTKRKNGKPDLASLSCFVIGRHTESLETSCCTNRGT